MNPCELGSHVFIHEVLLAEVFEGFYLDGIYLCVINVNDTFWYSLVSSGFITTKSLRLLYSSYQNITKKSLVGFQSALLTLSVFFQLYAAACQTIKGNWK